MEEKPYEGNIHQGCSCCPVPKRICPLDKVLAVGFGSCNVKRDDEFVYSEDPHMEFEDIPTLQKFEDMAAADSEHDWRVAFYGPLHEEEYQRQGPGRWVMIRSGEGFA